MSDKFKLNIFRIFQEQLNNILKHAKARDIYIALSKTEAGLILTIRDNGIGFKKTKRKMDGGIGIRNIIARAELYKGKADFVTEPGKGCELILTIPQSLSRR